MSQSWGLSAFGCGRTARMRATRTPVISAPGASRPSTSRPSRSSASAIARGSAASGTKSVSQDRGTRIRGRSVPGEEAVVVVEERLDGLDVVPEHRHALDPEAEREARVLPGVDADRPEDVRVDHAAPAELDPSRLRADATPGAVAEHA